MSIVLILIVVIFLGTTAAILMKLYSAVRARRTVLMTNIDLLKGEISKKRELLQQVGQIILGLTTSERISGVNSELSGLEDKLRGEQGRITITQAELDAIETRLRELEEVERELEASSIEASREVEMLKSQERDVQARNEALRSQLENAFLQIDKLLSQLHNSASAQEDLSRLKTELVSTQEKINWYTEEIARLNEKYLVLKRAYDAVDIEYAQLYEKHSALEAAQRNS